MVIRCSPMKRVLHN